MIEIAGSNPAFFETLLDVVAKIFIVWVTWAVIAIQSFLQILAGSASRAYECTVLSRVTDTHMSLISCKKSNDLAASFRAVGWLAILTPSGVPS